ncbi:hypothetical protein BC828DRAFT_140763 [Blastocladiella britannica]|nr:hypothetical protein BC828DRAFT_140763 [Blastocladiella britannica]
MQSSITATNTLAASLAAASSAPRLGNDHELATSENARMPSPRHCIFPHIFARAAPESPRLPPPQHAPTPPPPLPLTGLLEWRNLMPMQCCVCLMHELPVRMSRRFADSAATVVLPSEHLLVCSNPRCDVVVHQACYYHPGDIGIWIPSFICEFSCC